jgi:uncharacterized GH25 family protein
MCDDKLALMVRGHEIWLETLRADKDTAQMALLYGHNMGQDGKSDPKRLRPSVYSSKGEKNLCDIMPGENYNLLNVVTGGDGYYTAFVDMGTTVWSETKEGYNEGPKFQFKDVIYAGAYHQMAKTVVSVGDAGEYHSEPLHGILEIVPGKPNCSVGEELALLVYYEDKPLAGAEVKAVSKKEGKEMALIKADDLGTVRIPITADGEWMFLARHKDPSKKVSNEFDESVFICTLVLSANGNVEAR